MLSTNEHHPSITSHQTQNKLPLGLLSSIMGIMAHHSSRSPASPTFTHRPRSLQQTFPRSNNLQDHYHLTNSLHPNHSPHYNSKSQTPLTGSTRKMASRTSSSTRIHPHHSHSRGKILGLAMAHMGTPATGFHISAKHQPRTLSQAHNNSQRW